LNEEVDQYSCIYAGNGVENIGDPYEEKKEPLLSSSEYHHTYTVDGNKFITQITSEYQLVDNNTIQYEVGTDGSLIGSTYSAEGNVVKTFELS
jgi:hypothetical protein